MNFIERTIEVAKENVKDGGRPFACLIVKDGKVLVEAANKVAQTHDPTAHAEILAIQKGSQILQSEHFHGCIFYILAHPCPMCLAAMYYCSPDRVIFLSFREDYSKYYRDDRKYFSIDNFYEEIGKMWKKRKLPMEYCSSPQAMEVYKLWKEKNSL